MNQIERNREREKERGWFDRQLHMYNWRKHALVGQWGKVSSGLVAKYFSNQEKIAIPLVMSKFAKALIS